MKFVFLFCRMLSELLEALTNSEMSVEEVQELIRRGEVDVKETDCDGNNILHKVCNLDKEKCEIIEYLISLGAAANQVNSEGQTPLIICADKGYLSSLKVLLNNGACVDPHSAVKQGNYSGVCAAAKNRHVECVNELIGHGADIWYRNHAGETLLSVACEKNLPSLVKYCLENLEGLHQKAKVYHGLLCASTNGNIECVQKFLEVSKEHRPGEYPELYPGEYSITSQHPPVLAAAIAGHEDCVLKLLEHGYNISVQTGGKENLMMIAAGKGLHEALKQCIEKTDEDQFNRSAWGDKTAIMYACENKQYESLEMILNSDYCSNFLINQMSNSGFSALMICAKLGFLRGMNLLIQHGALIEVTLPGFGDIYGESDNNIDCNSALLLAAKAKNELCVKHLLDNGADIWYRNRIGENLLMVACEKGLSDTVQYCLAHGNFPQITAMDGNGATALHYSKDNISSMKLLLGSRDMKMNDILILGKTVPYLRESLLHTVCKASIERPDIVELLVSHSSVVDTFNCDGKTALMLCAMNGYLESLKVLIKYKASLNLVQRAHRKEEEYYDSDEEDYGNYESRKSDRRYTAIMMAAENGHEECVLELIEAGADISHVNNCGESLLVLAAEKGLSKALGKCLDTWKSQCIRKGVESEIYKNTVNTALHKAIDGQHEKCALVIIEHGADVWYSNQDGQNALMLASAEGLVNVVKAIVSRSHSNLKRKGKNGKCALSIALKNRETACVREILNFETLGEKLVKEMFQQAIQEGQSEAILYSVYVNRAVDAAFLIRYLKLCEAFGIISPDVDTERLKKEGRQVLSAAMACSQDYVNCLISEGDPFDHVNTHGKTLLMIAAGRGFLDTVKICLERGSQDFVNMRDDSNKNAVVYACEKKQSACLEEILKNKKTILDEANIETAMQTCEEQDYARGLHLLEKYGGELTTLSQRLWSFILEKDFEEHSWWRNHLVEQEVRLLFSDAQIWKTNVDGKNLLMTAIEMDLSMVVRYCVSKATFENLRAIDNNGNTALMLACHEHKASDHRETYGSFAASYGNALPMLCYMEEILKSDAAFGKEMKSVEDEYTDIDAVIYSHGKSLLQLACNRKEDTPDLVQLLVNKGASVNVLDARGFTPLMVCAKKGHLKSLHVLLEGGADTNISYIHLSNECSKIDSDSDEEPTTTTTQGNTALLIAATEGHEMCVLELISYEVNLWVANNKGENLLMLASSKGWEKVVQVCLDKGSPEQVNSCYKSGNNAIMYACKESQPNTLNLLLNDFKCLGQMDAFSAELAMSPLMTVVYDGCRRDIVALLLKKGADPNLENSEGVTSLMIAVGGNPLPKAGRRGWRSMDSPQRLEYVTLLLRYGAEVNHVCKTTGETALSVALTNCVESDVVQQLLEYGADVNHVDLIGNRPLKLAVENRELDITRLLLTKGASLSVENCESLRFWYHNDPFQKLLANAGLLPEQVHRSATEHVPSLYDMCRIPARQHVMNSFPNSNLFYMIPLLILPQLIKDFLLMEMNTNDQAQKYNSDDNDDDDDNEDDDDDDDDDEASHGKFLSSFTSSLLGLLSHQVSQ